MSRCRAIKVVKDPFSGEAELTCDLIDLSHTLDPAGLHWDELNDVLWPSSSSELLPARSNQPLPLKTAEAAA
jgi:hypothetical protein